MSPAEEKTGRDKKGRGAEGGVKCEIVKTKAHMQGYGVWHNSEMKKKRVGVWKKKKLLDGDTYCDWLSFLLLATYKLQVVEERTSLLHIRMLLEREKFNLIYSFLDLHTQFPTTISTTQSYSPLIHGISFAMTHTPFDVAFEKANGNNNSYLHLNLSFILCCLQANVCVVCLFDMNTICLLSVPLTNKHHIILNYIWTLISLHMPWFL